MTRAYYNENDKQAANWLRELIHEGHIAPGVVDDRSIHDVEARDLRGFAQCHFFAGIGVWSYALRGAGWSDDRPVWTGSCPCQPFSAAGKGAGFEDPRHLWPVWFRLIRECRPHLLFGEQVDAAVEWIDLVSADLEGDGYAFGAPDLPAAGFGGAHIRQRLYWVADADNAQWWTDRAPWNDGEWPQTGRVKGAGHAGGGGALIGLGYADGERERGSGLESEAGASSSPEGTLGGGVGQRLRAIDSRAGVAGWLGDTVSAGLPDTQFGFVRRAGRWPEGRTAQQPGDPSRPGVDWLFCRDRQWRPVEPGSSPLVDEAPARMATLRGYGNAIDAETARNFIAAYLAEAPSQARAA